MEDRSSHLKTSSQHIQLLRVNILGFTLIEILIAVLILAIIAAIAIPSYLSSTMQSRRSAAQSSLQQILELAQQYYLQNNAYPAAGNITGATGSTFGANLPSSITASPFYTYSVSSCGTNCLLAQAVVQGTQVKDTTCSCIQVDTAGNRYAFSATNCTGTSTTASCWTQ